MGERVCCYDYRRDLAACFRRQDVCGEKKKEHSMMPATNKEINLKEDLNIHF